MNGILCCGMRNSAEKVRFCTDLNGNVGLGAEKRMIAMP